jgi:flagellar protein FliO/FliZ
MFDTVFGAEMPLAVRFFLAFLIVLGLIGATAWAVRRFGAGRLGGGSARGRQPRLAVVDYASVDGRRRLILVRRDNIEHLMMIGGPTDVVVEANIVRATAAPRDMPGGRPTAGMDALPRAIPLPENGGGVGSWPLAPEPSVSSRATSRVEPLQDDMPRDMPREMPRLFQPIAEPPARAPQRDTLSALADELSSRPTPPRRPISRQLADEQQQEARGEPHPEPRRSATMSATMPVTPQAPAATPPAAAAEAEAGPDQSLADMAQRLEAALHQPEARPGATPPRTAAAEQAAPTPPMPPRPHRPEPKPAMQPKPGQNSNQGKTALYDSLEQEMASLLGRPTKT